ncbi:MAG: penicillin acylase family protein [Myxococcota bacterium]
MNRSLLSFLAAGALLAGCGDDDPTDTPPDGSVEAGTDADATVTGEGIESISAEREETFTGLDGTVDAVQDSRGVWHVYATTLRDASRVNGYLMARDRYGQMEFIKRSVTGRLAEIAGLLDPGLADDDELALWTGYVRQAEAIRETLTADELAVVQAYADGVNLYLAEVRNGGAFPNGTRQVVLLSNVQDWTVLDTLAIARFQAAALSFTLRDVLQSQIFDAWDDAFPAGDADTRLAARANAFHDLYPFQPIRDVYTRDGFPNVDSDGGTRAFRPGLPKIDGASPLPKLDAAVIRGAAQFAERFEASYRRWMGDESRGSNHWAVHGDFTESGNPILANDPHLQLSSPPLFWMSHINTMRAGGDIDVHGLVLAGTPIPILGFNESIAWGLTTHSFDVTDTYLEQITPGENGAPDTVLYNGAQVEIQTITYSIPIQGGDPREVVVEFVPHHGPIIPDSRTPTQAISVKWTGETASNELGAFRDLMTARNVEDARDAFQKFRVGGQNLMVIDADDIYWTTEVALPIRDPRALTYDPANPDFATPPLAPTFVLPGTGEYEWTGELSDQFLPHDLNPTNGYIATANNDGVGTTSDGNPFNDPHYIGGFFTDGHRIARIRERLDEIVPGGAVTVENMQEIQGDAQSPMGRLASAAIVAELDRAIAEAAAPGTHTDLEAQVAALGAATMTKIENMRDRLQAWTSFDTPAAVEGNPSAQEIADSVATSIFNASMGRIGRRTFDDEAVAIRAASPALEPIPEGNRDGSLLPRSGVILRMLNDPSSLATYDATIMDSVLWDDLRTAEVETRGNIILAAVADALTYLEAELGTDPEQWRWGQLHTLRLVSTVPQIGTDFLTVPNPTQPGFPRHGDNFVVDASHYGLHDTTSFNYGSGPVQRLVVEMTPDGPRAFNALPGGQSMDPESTHQRDEIELWRQNDAPAVYFTEDDVVTNAERRFRFTP